MKYSGDFWLHKGDAFDLGIDLCSTAYHLVPAGETKVIDTGTILDLPMFGLARRLLYRVILGIPIVGIGGLLKPRGRHDHDILSGVVDAGYRGSIKVKVYNCTNKPLNFKRGDSVAQFIPLLVLDLNLTSTMSGSITASTKRGTRGGINVR